MSPVFTFPIFVQSHCLYVRIEMDLQAILNLREILKIGRKKVQGNNCSMNKDEKTVMRNHNDDDDDDDNDNDNDDDDDDDDDDDINKW